MPTYFTGFGASTYVLSQIAKVVTAVIFLLVIWDFIQVPELGWIRGNERSSPILLSALAAMFAAAVAVLGSVARPTGPGTGKWWLNDGFYTVVLALALVIGLIGWNVLSWNHATIVLTGIKLDIAIIVTALVAIQIFATSIADRTQDMMAPVTATPRMPAPVINSFTTSAATIPAGSSVVLNWALTHATDAEINGGVVPTNGPMSFTPAGVAGDVVTFTLIVRGPGSVPGTPVTRTIGVTLT